MENPEEILHSLEEFAKLRPKSIPRELEEYLCFVAKTGDPVYQWSVIKCLFREKLINVITEFYESCPSVSIPSCRNVDIFNYDTMKTFILEKLDTFVSAPFTVQRICELLTTPRKEYNRIDKYMRALEKNILVVSTTEPGNHRTPENGDGFVNGNESDHGQDGSHDINIEEMDDTPIWQPKNEDSYQSTSREPLMVEKMYVDTNDDAIEPEPEAATSQTIETVICSPSDPTEDQTFTPVAINNADNETTTIITEEKSETEPVANEESIETVPAVVQRRRTSIEPPSEEPPQETPQPMPNIEENVDAEIAMEKQKIPLEAGDFKEDVLPQEPKEESIPDTTPTIDMSDMSGAGDGPAATTTPTAESIELIEQAEQAEIDVTSFASTPSTKLEDSAMPVEMQDDSPEAEPEPQATEELALPIPEQEQHQDQENIEIPQAEASNDPIPQETERERETETETEVKEQEPLEIENTTTECSKTLAMDNLAEDTIAASEAPVSTDIVVQEPEITTVEAPEENSALSISNEQKTLEMLENPELPATTEKDTAEAVVAEPAPIVTEDATVEDSAMVVESAIETPTVEDAPNESTNSADSNN